VQETVEEVEALQRLLDASAQSAGPHLRDIMTDDRRLTADELCTELQGMRLLVLATATADGRPLVGPVDGYFVHGAFFFSSGKESVRMRHIGARPFVSATYLPGEHLAITVHGRAEIFEISDPKRPELRQAMLDHYLPLQGPAFEEWLNEGDSFGARIEADKLFTFAMKP
jgi:general stress protein 26